MSQAQLSAELSTQTRPIYPTFAPRVFEMSLATTVYRSRATAEYSYLELQALAHAAQSRNEAESITGLMVYDSSFFYQWLEGPAESVARVMSSIRQDPRHTEIEILSRKSIPARVFGGWSMKLATRSPQGGAWQRDVLYPRLDTIRTLHQHPETAAHTLAAMGPDSNAALGPNTFQTAGSGAETSALIKSLIQAAVIPELLTHRRIAPARPVPLILDLRVSELADLLLHADSGAALNLIHEQYGDGQSPLPLFATLLEPAARRLGDLWAGDICSEFDLTVGLGHLQTASRLLGHESLSPFIAGPAPAVLVVPLPGELHALGAALDSEAMWQEGWSPQSEFPTDDAALEKILTGTWFDVLDLSLSVALRHEHWLPRMTKTINLARRASRNPGLLVTVGGRVFADQDAGAGDVMANFAGRTASNIVPNISRILAAARRPGI